MSKRIILFFVSVFIVILSFADVFAEEPFHVGTWKLQQTIQPFVYNKFLPKNIDVEVKTFTNPGDQKNALLAGSLDFTGTTIVQAIISSSKGEPVVLVSGLTNKCSALVAGNDSGINKPSDLKGKRIGYVPGTMHHILLLETLSKAGLSAKDVELIRVDFFDMAAALGRKQIDAFLSGEPAPTLVQSSGSGRILSYPYFDDSIGKINAGMLVTREMIQKHPEKVQALVTAHAKATEYLKKNPNIWLDEAAKLGQKPEILKAAASNIDLIWDIDDTFITHAKNLAAKMKELGVIEKMPDWNTLFDTRFVKAARKAL